jgi:cyclopropane-fatty-acyl-phospholipid synthase
MIETIERKLSELNLPLEVVLWDKTRICPSGNPEVSLTIHSPRGLNSLIRPTLGKIAKAYVNGVVDIDGDVKKTIRIGESFVSGESSTYQKNLRIFDWWRHTRPADRQAIQHHYDVGNEFYRLWLDKNHVYSCGYFKTEGDSLDEAQENKLDHICRKLDLKPGDKLLDIGCGWGALVIWAATHYGADATGITLSDEQYRLASEKIKKLGLERRCRVKLLDYRDLDFENYFDKVSSVGMFEHVGKANLSTYFQKIFSVLKHGGVVMNHGITTNSLDDHSLGSDIGKFVDEYVFPGGELVHLSTVIEKMSSQGLEPWDSECLRPHYARTLWNWVDRLDRNAEQAKKLIGEQRYRIWRIYMAGSAHAFDRGWISIFQILALKPMANGAVSYPPTRGHVYD